ncbi:hypothetical protein [Actinobaculum suis]|uniref:hypothetical protein n=1 Tax=Actinobaculum suis TaxID=1657 RepID=UPI00080A6D72|nr:hypothetical protein [Actinobaculum suis]OCA94840.1 hypothetical protein ACU20_05565 [Actinobaculum suis]
MSSWIILSDTSILLSFICSRNEHFLIAIAERLDTSIQIPNAVANEMERKLGNRRFSAGTAKWHTLLQTGYITVLSDENPKLIPTIEGWTGPGFDTQDGLAKDLGEYMAIAHAKEFQKNKRNVALLVDDGGAQELAKRNGIACLSSEDVLELAVKKGMIATKVEAQKIWTQLSAFDVQVPFERTRLAKKALYQSSFNP